ncbi:major facilitator superfamily MFS_1 [Beutenbergia cavernae DSM 12333]|uniref:Major facilitator superfamily MFS_1 n=1 Tax=Beutenbergia cavernae (strain ATCC BAA-8 / DSM 12333 / CCUG 43141 / JCM 11478 / NBRC 16432 / NCIMB 13614 / HKI 0122) TaxID=471853 RepID=C5C3E9_BEUC1|nr:MFS transporter [Beutenbergia cavernae]ACQ79848.1 major facilitator superfamily MFS_1 [Beutenbergia cavernae DSM 12333]
MTQSPVPRRLWLWVVLLGLTGQLAWTVENMYLNVFVYDTITDSPTVLATLVACSALAATVATLLAGAASDRSGRRRELIAGGYVLWGACTAAFGLVSVDGAASIAPAMDAVVVAVIAIILLDCVMSVLGATANDAAFNAWVTDSTNPGNRGRVDGVLATMPLLAMLVVFGALDPLTKSGNWRLFFTVVGAATAVVGVIAWFGVRDSRQPRPGGTYLASVLHGLRPATARANPRLYLALAAWAVLGTSTQVFLPYLIIYVQRYLDIDAYAVVLASVLIGAAVISVVGGRVLDRVGPSRGILPVAAAYAAGLIAMFFARGMLPVIGAGIVMMSGFMLGVAAISATVRNLTPPDRAGQVQGLRMVFAILVPMVVGPFLGAAVIAGADETFVDLGVVKQVPTPWIFLTAALVVAAVVVPVRLLRRHESAGTAALVGTPS